MVKSATPTSPASFLWSKLPPAGRSAAVQQALVFSSEDYLDQFFSQSEHEAPPPQVNVQDPAAQKSLQRTALRLLSTLTTYSPDRDQDTALTGELKGTGSSDS